MKLLPLFGLLVLTSALRAEPSLGDILAVPAGAPTTLNRDQVTQLLKLAAARDWNVFDLLTETALFLKATNRRVVIDGDDLRAAAGGFEMGGVRVDTFLPRPLVVSLAAGARLGADADVEIHLSRPYSAFLELGDFDVGTTYGFRDVSVLELGGAYGVTVRNGLFRWTLQKVARVPDPTGQGSKHFIAIHLNNFFRPKRWKIEAIRTLAPPTIP